MGNVETVEIITALAHDDGGFIFRNGMITEIAATILICMLVAYLLFDIRAIYTNSKKEEITISLGEAIYQQPDKYGYMLQLLEEVDAKSASTLSQFIVYKTDECIPGSLEELVIFINRRIGSRILELDKGGFRDNINSDKQITKWKDLLGSLSKLDR